MARNELPGLTPAGTVTSYSLPPLPLTTRISPAPASTGTWTLTSCDLGGCFAPAGCWAATCPGAVFVRCPAGSTAGGFGKGTGDETRGGLGAAMRRGVGEATLGGFGEATRSGFGKDRCSCWPAF